MDHRFMQPSRLNLEASSATASKEWRHWFKTFENYVEVLDASLGEKNRTDRLNCVSHEVYEYIEECTTYETAIATLKILYTKAPNKVFARHRLATAKQEPGQSLNDFLLSLQKLAKDCNFGAVTSAEYRQEMVRDAFINGLVSSGIRQKLLEHRELNLDTAVEKARAIELVQTNSEFYTNSQDFLCEEVFDNKSHCCEKTAKSSSKLDTISETESRVSKLCSFYGRSNHLRSIITLLKTRHVQARFQHLPVGVGG